MGLRLGLYWAFEAILLSIIGLDIDFLNFILFFQYFFRKKDGLQPLWPMAVGPNLLPPCLMAVRSVCF
jgi:hypothetical protein